MSLNNHHVELAPTPRACASCGSTLEGMRSNAKYCSRKCKAAAAERRRPQRDHSARYLKERDRRLAYALDPERMREAASRRRARVRSAERCLITKKDWLRLAERFRHSCAYCGERKPLTMEHVVPLSRGGRHSIGNIIPACFSCNSSKRDRFIVEWRNRIPSPHQRRVLCVTQEETAS